MSTSVIRCPGCGAADTSSAGPSGVHTCVYCGVRYQISQGMARTIAAGQAAPASVSPVRLVVGGAALMLVALVAAALIIRWRDAPPPPRPGPSPAIAPLAALPAATPAENRTVSVTPAENKTVSVTPPAEEVAPATAAFSLETARRSGDALWIYGYFHNTSPFTLGKTKITAVFYDKDGKEIGQDSGYTEDDVIAADARVPCVLLASGAPQTYDRIEFEIRAERPSYLPRELSGLEIEADAPRKEGFLGWKFAGKVHNRSGEPAKFVMIEVLGFNEDDKLAGRGFTYAVGDEVLAPDAAARFDGSLLDSSTTFTRFEFRVSGRPAQ